MRKAPNNLVKSLNKAINVLEELGKYEHGLRLTELSDNLGLHKSSVHRLLSTLAYRGLVEQEQDTNKYKLGLKIFELGSRIFNDLEIREYASDYLKEMVDRVGEAAHLVVLDQGEVLYLHKVESPKTIRMHSEVGRRASAHCTAAGKVILAYLAEEEVNEILEIKGLTQYTENTITEIATFKQQLESIRTKSYAIDREEHQLGICCIAAPIFDYTEQVVAAVSLSGPTIRITRDRIPELATLVKKTTQQISSRLGYNK
ncbi:IclR family transcriptional regulator [Fuchsiella alkaliacetigena]|uniref:IclR family transcriptional regulator n=1 Tax=Fuchsiella alkaliacetigena TaxID=957042 RepID=UPI00200AE476|nr:IclR family transcriptional regulator [Fuchsiella alkaliacetigena]MCK8824774.1 IclR family transcriptional regulator [Fuchsiella alkaliacetigena]